MVWACVAKKDNDFVKKCMEYEVDGSRPSGRPKRTGRDVEQKDCQACESKREDTVNRSNIRRKLVKDG